MRELDESIDTLLDSGRLESIQAIDGRTNSTPSRHDIDTRLLTLKRSIKNAQAQGDMHQARCLTYQLKALTIFRDFGFDPDKLIEPVDLSPGYSGKFLLVIIRCRFTDSRTCLRSGDDWHREILHNTELEFVNLGFENFSVTPAGGAEVQFNDRHEITIYGTSDEYGACDKQLAATLISKQFPSRSVRILA